MEEVFDVALECHCEESAPADDEAIPCLLAEYYHTHVILKGVKLR